jgi:hypothetical protein
VLASHLTMDQHVDISDSTYVPSYPAYSQFVHESRQSESCRPTFTRNLEPATLREITTIFGAHSKTGQCILPELPRMRSEEPVGPLHLHLYLHRYQVNLRLKCLCTRKLKRANPYWSWTSARFTPINISLQGCSKLSQADGEFMHFGKWISLR